ncbi:MAG: TraX family protein [Polyangiaceae bacterium]
MTRAVAKHQASQAGGLSLPRLAIADGTIEALKWLGLVLMSLDHVNKYVLHEGVPGLFYAGRLAMPLFAFVLAFNLARPNSLASGAYGRVAGRLAVFGALACVPFIALGGLAWGWWPLNMMFTLLVATGTLYLAERGGAWRIAAAVALFIVGGANVEFWWPAVTIVLAAWRYVRRPSWLALAVWVAASAALFAINRNFWALAALPIIFAAPHVSLQVPRLRTFFYAFYPAHLALLWLLLRFA